MAIRPRGAVRPGFRAGRASSAPATSPRAAAPSRSSRTRHSRTRYSTATTPSPSPARPAPSTSCSPFPASARSVPAATSSTSASPTAEGCSAGVNGSANAWSSSSRPRTEPRKRAHAAENAHRPLPRSMGRFGCGGRKASRGRLSPPHRAEDGVFAIATGGWWVAGGRDRSDKKCCTGSLRMPLAASVPPSVPEHPGQPLREVVPPEPPGKPSVGDEGPKVIIGFVATRATAQEIETSSINGPMQTGDVGQSDDPLAANFRVPRLQRLADSGQDRVRVRMVESEREHSHPNERLAPAERSIDRLRPFDPAQRGAVLPVQDRCRIDRAALIRVHGPTVPSRTRRNPRYTSRPTHNAPSRSAAGVLGLAPTTDNQPDPSSARIGPYPALPGRAGARQMGPRPASRTITPSAGRAEN